MDDCSYCHGVRLVGWSGAGPILCPTCSSGADTFTVITHAWREQRKRAIEAENECDRLRAALQVAEGKSRDLQATLDMAVQERELFREEREGAFEKAASIEQQSATLAARLRAEKASMRTERDAAIARAENAERESDETHGRMVSFKREALELRRRNNKLNQRLVALQTLVKRKLRPRLRAATDMCMQLHAERDTALARAEKAERERDEAKTIASNIARSWVAEAEKARAEAAELRAEVERLREALGFYAAAETWETLYTDDFGAFDCSAMPVGMDGEPVAVPGKRAREALAKAEALGRKDG